MNCEQSKDQKGIELSGCNFIKTVLMLCIVVYHSILFWGGNWFFETPVYAAEPLKWIARWMNSFHIYGFTLVSGYLFFYLKHEKGKYEKFLPFVRNKAKRLLIPYGFIAVCWVIPISCVFSETTLDQLLRNYVLGIAPSQLWFLLMLFGVFVIFHPLSDFFKKHDRLGSLVALGFYGAGFLLSIKIPNVFRVFDACTYLPLFFVGFKIRQHGSGLLRKIPSLVWVAAHVLLFVLTQYLDSQKGIVFSVLHLGFRFALHVVGALMAFVVLGKLAERVRWKESRVFTTLSRYSMPVYLLHQQVIYFSLYWLNGVLNPYLHAGVNLILSLTVSLLLSALLMKWKPTRFLIGEK